MADLYIIDGQTAVPSNSRRDRTNDDFYEPHLICDLFINNQLTHLLVLLVPNLRDLLLYMKFSFSIKRKRPYYIIRES